MTKTGIVEFILSNVGSKSEKMQPFLKEADGNLVEIFKETDNPFKNDSLKEYEGKTVTVTGDENEYGLFIIDTIEVLDAVKATNETVEKAAVEVIEEKTAVTEEAEKKAEEATETASETEEAAAPTETPAKPPLKGFKKFLAFFHRK